MLSYNPYEIGDDECETAEPTTWSEYVDEAMEYLHMASSGKANAPNEVFIGTAIGHLERAVEMLRRAR